VFYVSKSGDSVFDKVMQGMAHEGFNNIIQFATIFYLLWEEKPDALPSS